jgi:hypothetical protein
MTTTTDMAALAPRPVHAVVLQEFESALLDYLRQQGLPADSILVPVEERALVFANVPVALAKLNASARQESVYISKFLAAVASGLFDAALNYLWDETIHELRRRVAQYDLSYFFEAAVKSTDKRKGLKTEADLVKLDDCELIHGAHEIELLSDIGFRHLEYVRYMRNWASAAHPNQNEITGLQLLSWLQACIREVIALPISSVAVQINKLLFNIKNHDISEDEAREIGATFLKLNQEQSNKLCNGFFGIYVYADSSAQTRQNIRRLLPYLWDSVDETTRQQLGVRYGKYAANSDQTEKAHARRFLETVGAVAYIPDDFRAGEVQTAIDNLVAAHRGWGNFYNEPPFAQALWRLVGDEGRVPQHVSRSYALALTEVFVTNGNGEAWHAAPLYERMIRAFTPKQALTGVLAFKEPHIASRLRWPLCQKKYRQLLGTLKTKVGSPAVVDLIEQIERYPGALDELRDDAHIQQAIVNVQKIVG